MTSVRLSALIGCLLVSLAPAAVSGAERNSAEPGYYERSTSAQPAEPSETWMLAFGGRLYDNWWIALLRDPPAAAHPGYPANGGYAGPQSWRCVACHGWDYKGVAGQFRDGPYRTGIKGIDGMAGAEPMRIVAILHDDNHRYTSSQLPERAMKALALFVSKGQVDMDGRIDPRSHQIRADKGRGERIFQTVCAVCHDFDGRAWIIGEDDDLRTLGAIASKNPWRAIHRVMNSQTAADMPALRAFGLPTVLDILSYVQTLPER